MFCFTAIPNPCDAFPCQNNGQCTRVQGQCYSYQCTCAAGFTGINCQTRRCFLNAHHFVNHTGDIMFVCLLELAPEGKSVSGYISTHNNRPGHYSDHSQQSFTPMGETIKAYRLPFVDETSWSSPLIQKQEIVAHVLFKPQVLLERSP